MIGVPVREEVVPRGDIRGAKVAETAVEMIAVATTAGRVIAEEVVAMIGEISRKALERTVTDRYAVRVTGASPQPLWSATGRRNCDKRKLLDFR